MHGRILVPTDGSPSMEEVIDYTHELATVPVVTLSVTGSNRSEHQQAAPSG